jgi:hypothetical protein
MATSLSILISDTSGCVIFRRLSIAQVSGQPWEDFQLNHLVLAFLVCGVQGRSAARFADPIRFTPTVSIRERQPSNSTTAREAFVDVDGGRLYYEECGTGADAVVLLQDGVVNSAVWDDVWPAFCKRFHAIRYDRRGYGRSSVTTKPYYEADDLAAVLQDRKVIRAALVASSHGGEVALNFALR